MTESNARRDELIGVAWEPWHLFSEGKIDEGLSLLSDDGTFWEVSSRESRPMPEMKTFIAQLLSIVPIRFTLIDAIVEGNRAVLLAESEGHIDANEYYRNAYSFVVRVDPASGQVVSVREYSDTLHGFKVLVPVLRRASIARNETSKSAEVIES
ncbi:hypothetical protein A5692_11990 [Mycobacterium sp. E342]|uniref:nuclear transport factor 2 family protein n=1 Tax=unclassified Mycobacterium TaxID=2642494 RepID=UPI0007FC9F59|nr:MULTISPECIES: hypothetical protein [unclassified Mycobacterium]OBH13952.1 hypothetical protein A9X04_15260 [Mycobacterium sp. E3247]OBH35324.1 hypothetical protein A5692_11990 [Mycobacterium sp. E342]